MCQQCNSDHCPVGLTPLECTDDLLSCEGMELIPKPETPIQPELPIIKEEPAGEILAVIGHNLADNQRFMEGLLAFQYGEGDQSDKGFEQMKTATEKPDPPPPASSLPQMFGDSESPLSMFG